jgi:hypothetical protein
MKTFKKTIYTCFCVSLRFKALKFTFSVCQRQGFAGHPRKERSFQTALSGELTNMISFLWLKIVNRIG